MNLHICTTQSLRAGCEQFPPFECWLCGNETMFLSWTDARCDTCGADGSEIAWSIRIARQRLKLTRRAFAERMGVSPKTVSVYDWRPSRVYVERAKAWFHAHYNHAPHSFGG